MNIDPAYIWILIFIGGAIIGRELWLQKTISRLSTDVAWIKRLLIDNNKEKGGDE